MTEQRIRTAAEVTELWNQVGCDRSLPIFRIAAGRGAKFPVVGDYAQLLICKKEYIIGAPTFGLFTVSAELGNYGIKAMDPVLYLKDEGRKGEAFFNYRGAFASAVEWLEDVDCRYTGQNYVDGETLVFGSLNPYSDTINGKSFDYCITRTGLCELIDYPGVILGRYYFVDSRGGYKGIDLSINNKDGYKSDGEAMLKALIWARENV